MAAAGVPVSAIEALGRRAGECNRMLEEGTGAGADFLGWVSLPSSVTETELRRVKDAAEKLRAVADVVVVVGIGGSYLGARAVLEALGNPFACLRRERSGPDVVFADEPTGNLDSKTTVEIMEMICTFARRYHQTIILVTHDPEMAAYADRIVRLIDGTIVSDEPRHR